MKTKTMQGTDDVLKGSYKTVVNSNYEKLVIH